MVDISPTTIVTFLLWTGSVGVLTWYIVTKLLPKQESSNASEDYFAGGNSLKWYVVAGSLMLTNLSSEQLVGLNGTVFKDGALCGIWWEAGASLAMMIMATVFLPEYMSQGIITTSSYLGERYAQAVRSMVSIVFVIYYSCVLCPTVLYAGALAVIEIFEWQGEVELWIVSTIIGTIGAIYAISGGLKAVAVSDCLNGIGLLIVGLWVPIAAIQKIDGGFTGLFDEPDRLKVLLQEGMIYDVDRVNETAFEAGDATGRFPGIVSVPWHVTFFGLTVNNIYYWATNQVIVQRVLGAQSLAEGQKGVLFAACMKIVGFTFLCLPGLIAVLMQDEQILDQNDEPFLVTKSVDTVFPKVVNAVLPKEARGLFLGVLLGSVLSTFNSALNSSSTMFALEIYNVYINKEADPQRIVTMANIFGVILTLGSFVLAPQLEGTTSLFNLLQTANTIVALPILSVFFVGIFTVTPDAVAGIFGFIIGAIVILTLTVISETTSFDLHFLHVFEIAFTVSVSSIFLMTYSAPMRTCVKADPEPIPYEKQSGKEKVDLTPWAWRFPVIGVLLVSLTLLLVSLQFANWTLFIIFWIFWVVALVFLMAAPVHASSAHKSDAGVALTASS